MCAVVVNQHARVKSDWSIRPVPRCSSSEARRLRLGRDRPSRRVTKLMNRRPQIRAPTTFATPSGFSSSDAPRFLHFSGPLSEVAITPEMFTPKQVHHECLCIGCSAIDVQGASRLPD